MLVLRRKDGQWIEMTHRSGDVIRFRVYDVAKSAPGQVNVAFDDPARNFDIQRPERLQPRLPAPSPAIPLSGPIDPSYQG